MADLESGGGIGIVGGGEGSDDLGGGLDAAEERGNEEAVKREGEKVEKSPTRIEGPNQAILVKRGVKRAGGGGRPGPVEVVEPVTVTHNDDVLVKVRVGAAVGYGFHIGNCFFCYCQSVEKDGALLCKDYNFVLCKRRFI